MLRQRLLLGPVMLALLVAVFYLDNRLEGVVIEGAAWQWLFFGQTSVPGGVLLLGVLFGLIILVASELVQIFRAKGINADALMMPLSGMSVCAVVYGGQDGVSAVAVLATLMAALFMATLLRSGWTRRVDGAAGAAAATMFGATYLGVLPAFFLLIRRSHSAWVVAAVMLIPKCCDIAAYFVGRAVGRRKLIPWLSPGKTWEGLLGGVAAAAAVTVGLAALGDRFGVTGRWVVGPGEIASIFETQAVPLWFAAVAGAVLGVVGQLGDLVASLFKRDAGLKDSGRSVPGFGGLLDVVDSPLLVAPVAYWLLELAFLLDKLDVNHFTEIP